MDFVAFNLRWPKAWVFFLPIAAVAMALWMAGLYGDAPTFNPYSSWNLPVWGGWIGVGLLALWGVVGIWKFFDTPEQLRISPKGIRYMPWSDQLLPWPDIVEITTSPAKRPRNILLQLRDPAQYPSKGTMLKHPGWKPAEGDVAILVGRLDCKLNEAMAAIARFRR